jgi:hypothetical protein
MVKIDLTQNIKKHWSTPVVEELPFEETSGAGNEGLDDYEQS